MTAIKRTQAHGRKTSLFYGINFADRFRLDELDELSSSSRRKTTSLTRSQTWPWFDPPRRFPAQFSTAQLTSALRPGELRKNQPQQPLNQSCSEKPTTPPLHQGEGVNDQLQRHQNHIHKKKHDNVFGDRVYSLRQRPSSSKTLSCLPANEDAWCRWSWCCFTSSR